jgi:hypothetical protein
VFCILLFVLLSFVKSCSNKATLLLRGSHRCTKYTAVITNWLTVTTYPIFKWQWIFSILRRLRLSSITDDILSGLDYVATRRVSYNKQELLTFRECLGVLFLLVCLFCFCLFLLLLIYFGRGRGSCCSSFSFWKEMFNSVGQQFYHVVCFASPVVYSKAHVLFT